jgi:hypothetical protein
LVLVKSYSKGESFPHTSCTFLCPGINSDIVSSQLSYLTYSAIDKAQSIPLSELGADPLLKLTGLYITLSAMQENAGQLRKAFRTLSTGLSVLDKHENERTSTDPIRSIKDRERSIALSQKMGSLALIVSEPGRVSRQYTPGSAGGSSGVDKEWEVLAEKYLTRAVEEMIPLGTSHLGSSSSSSSSSKSGNETETAKVVGRDFNFPSDQDQTETEAEKGDREISGRESIAKVTKKTMGLTMESLADLYARQGRFE